MDTSNAVPAAAAVVALKPSEYAKSRLDLPAPLRQHLAETMALDTLRALAAAVSRVVVVSGQPALASRLTRAGIPAAVLPEPAQPGMNAALAYGAERLRTDGFGSVLACVGDLPALRTASVSRVLQASAPVPRAFLADASGTGTTMLVANQAPLLPAFSGRSAARHRAGGALPLTNELLGEPLADARRDVDTEIDLAAATGLGVGPFTGALVDPASGRLGQYQVVTTTDWTDDLGQRMAVTAAGRRVVLPDGVVGGAGRSVRSGQRLHAVTAAGRVLSAWW
jgi:2-phospho-L-lactate/phosphoenolpyruvate guanylyltransferase